MFDFTPHIVLTKKQSVLYKYERFFLYLSFLLLGLFLLYKILFPAAYFLFDFSKPNALANTIAKPYKIDNDIIFDAAAVGSFDKAQIEITVVHDLPTSSTTLSVQRGYVAGFYPLASSNATNQKNSNKNSIAGLLFIKQNGVWVVIDDNTVAPIAGITTLLGKGWSFDKIVPLDQEQISTYAKRRIFTLKDAHPNGTIFDITKNTKHDHYERILNNKRYVISKEIIDKYYSKNEKITLHTESHTISHTCQLESKLSLWKSKNAIYTCDVSLEAFDKLIGTDYHFTLQNMANTEILNLNVVAYRNMTIDNLKNSLRLIKQRLLQHYIN